MAQTVKNLHAMQETQVRFLGKENPLEREWLPSQIFLSEEFQTIIHGVTKSQT